MTSQGEGQEEQESPIPLQVFEFQIEPDRNAIIRRALAKRIVRQREVDEEEASTEEDESFLAGDSIATRRSIASTPVSPRKRTPEGQQQGKMNAKSRWKTEYLRTRSSSPSGSSTFATEVIVAEGSTSVPEASDTKPNGDTLIVHEEPKKDDSTDYTGAEPNLMNMDKDKGKDREPPPSLSETAPSEETKQTENGVGTARQPSPDLVEEELLAKLENLKKEKSRLFALFRSTLQRKEEGSSTAPTSSSSVQQPPQPLQPPPPPPPPPIPPQMPAEMRARELAKRSSDSKETSKTEDHEKRNDTSRSIPKRREGERVIDRSKLNLEIPRKPSVSSSTTNSASSTSSTPTFGPSASGTSFSYPQRLKPKRPRSISPTHSHPSQSTTISSNNNNNNNTSSIAGRGTSNYSEPSSSKYPRADYGPPSSTSSSHSRNSSNGSTFGSHTTNVLPEKPQVRYPGGNRSHHSGSANDDHYHRPSNKASGSGSGSGSSGNLLSSSSISSLPAHGANGGGNPSYRQQHSSSYHPQGPSRGGFGMRGRGGYFGHGEGGLGTGSNSGGGPISLLGPPGRPLPFNRNMMQMPHTRGPFHNRLGFGRGGGGGEDDGRGRGRGGIGRHPSSPRGEWPRRRSRD